MEKIKELIIKYREIIVYIIFGVLTTLVNWAVYTVLVKYCGADVLPSNAAAWTAGVLFAFITNKFFVFESKSFKASTVLKEFFSFVGARAFTGAMEIFGVPLLEKAGLDKTFFGIKASFAKLIVSVAVVVLNYVFSKLLVFRKKKSEENAKADE